MKDHWKVRENLDPTTGRVERSYTYKRKPCERIPLDSPMARQMAGYALIEKDLRSVLSWLEEIKSRHTEVPKRDNENFARAADRQTYTLIKGLFVAALTFYGKCFATCEGRRIKLERSQLGERYLSTHDEAITYRHNFAAHSGAAKLEDVVIALIVPKKTPAKVLPRIYSELWQPDVLWSRTQEGSFADLAEHARSIAVRKLNELNKKIMLEDVLPKGFDYWRRK
jgi:hypothetical protein